eukprot:956225-Karenia_brevis.AAC.1
MRESKEQEIKEQLMRSMYIGSQTPVAKEPSATTVKTSITIECANEHFGLLDCFRDSLDKL